MVSHYESDHLGSDGIQDILDLSRAEYESSQDWGHHQDAENVAGPSTVTKTQVPVHLRKRELNGRLSSIDTEVEGVEADIAKLQELRETLLAEKQKILRDLQGAQQARVNTFTSKGKSKEALIDYNAEFEWTAGLKSRMKKVFGIDKFRLCQEGVCNANMDGRDIVCIMPTGGGKSLTYQLPALMVPGCTLVISPLISLITDQILHLQEAGVNAVMVTGSTTREQSGQIFRDLTLMSQHGVSAEKEIKLCYVTPEKIVKSKTFLSQMEKLAKANKLARIVIDEAHCVSQLGHDYRPDYKKLNMLRNFLPKVPILALSATCPPKVLDDLIHILGLKPPVDSRSATVEGTVYFSSPLYRKNLHYTILPKPSAGQEVMQMMTDYILDKHKGHSGIVYCHSKKDAESVSQSLSEKSNGKIKSGVYHANVDDGEKMKLHERWREGKVQVVCATIAFGLGIDKGDVRFMPKSLDGFYQESGRAGRDGQDADCVLYYRPQDAPRMAKLIVSEVGAGEKLHDMIRFAQDLKQCRKVHFAKYFSMSSNLSIAAWSTEEEAALTPCGHCDNCTRPPETVDCADVTIAAWQILKIAEVIQSKRGHVTLSQLVDLARGTGKGSFSVGAGGKKRAQQSGALDLESLVGGEVQLSKENTERLCVHLLINDYLKETFHQTAYDINVHIIPGKQALRLTRVSRADLEKGKGPRLECCFWRKAKRKSGKTPKKPLNDNSGLSANRDPTGDLSASERKRKAQTTPVDDDDDDMDMDSEDIGDLDGPISGEDGEDEHDEWDFSLEPRSRPAKRPRQSSGDRKPPKAAGTTQTSDLEVISISSD